MKKIITTFIALLLTVGSVKAFDGYKSLYVHFDDGSVQSFLLTPDVVIKTNAYDFIVKVGDRENKYPRNSVVSIKYVSDQSSLPSVTVDQAVSYFKVDGDILFLSGIEGPAILRIFSVDGREVLADNVDQFTTAVNIAGIPSGVYIVTDGNITEKIIVP